VKGYRPFYVHLFNCLLSANHMAASYQPITWQQLNACRHVDMCCIPIHIISILNSPFKISV